MVQRLLALAGREVDLRQESAPEGENAPASDSESGEGANDSEKPENIRELRLWHLGKAVDLKG